MSKLLFITSTKNELDLFQTGVNMERLNRTLGSLRKPWTMSIQNTADLEHRYMNLMIYTTYTSRST